MSKPHRPLKEHEKQKIAEFRKKEHEEQLIHLAQEQEERRKREKRRDYCYDTNLQILRNLIRQCPKNHLIVIERTCCTSTITFDESIEVLLEGLAPEEEFHLEEYSYRVIVNPANSDDTYSTLDHFFGWPEYEGSYSIINYWRFIPYPSHWEKISE